MFTSATSLLPSSFTMYMLTLSAAAVLNSDHRRVVLYAMVGVMWGWAVAGVAFLPYALLLLLVGAPIVYLPAGVVFLFGTVTPMIAFDRLFYGKWTVSSVACSAPVCVLAIWTTKQHSSRLYSKLSMLCGSGISKAAFAVPTSVDSPCVSDMLHCNVHLEMLHYSISTERASAQPNCDSRGQLKLLRNHALHCRPPHVWCC